MPTPRSSSANRRPRQHAGHPQSFVNRQRQRLVAERASLVERLSLLQEDAALWLASEGVEDSFDEEGGEGSALAVELANDGALQVLLTDNLEEVDAALGRIDAGTYGCCDACGEAIADGRLEALPIARQCVRCKSAGPLRRRIA